MAQVVRTVVGRPIQVASVNGLKRNLGQISNIQRDWMVLDLRCGHRKATPPLILPRRRKELGRYRFPRICNLHERIGTQEIHSDVQQVCEDRICRGIREEGEEGEQQWRLVVYAAIVGRDIAVIEEQALLHYYTSA